jgi:hypothetical protein
MSVHGYAIKAVALAATLFAGQALAAESTYVNERFGTSITFPAEVFTERMPPPENGDGQSWQAADGGTLLVYGRYNVLDETPESLTDKARRDGGRRLTYSRTGKHWVVLSGIAAGSVFYERHEFGKDDVIHSVVVGYPLALKAKYDLLAGAIAGSLEGP